MRCALRQINKQRIIFNKYTVLMFETGIKDLVNIMQMNYSSHLLFDKRFDGVFILKNGAYQSVSYT